MKEYEKTSKNNEELADLLMDRGLVADRSALLRVLETVGYYRFSGYLVPFRDRDSENYRTGTKLDEVWGIYMFDRHLRLLTMDALARIEIAIRALITRCHVEENPDPFSYTVAANMPKFSSGKHGELLAHIRSAVKKAAASPAVRHLREEYGIEDYPPVWMMMELVPMGTVTSYYHGLSDSVQKHVADVFHVRPNVFGQWLMALKTVRNICAHHSRLWNAHIVVPFSRKIGRAPELAAMEECVVAQQAANYTTAFTALSLIAYCIGVIRPESQWRVRAKSLFATATPFVLNGMGFPADWQTLALWK